MNHRKKSGVKEYKQLIQLNNMTWYYLDKADIEFFKGKVNDKLYYQLLHQSIKRIPMLKESYESLKRKYGE